MGEIHELFVLAVSLLWFAGATPDRKTVFGRFLWLFRGFSAAFSWPSFWANFTRTRPGKVVNKGNESIYLHRSGPLLENLTGQRIAMVDMVFLVFTAFPYLP